MLGQETRPAGRTEVGQGGEGGAAGACDRLAEHYEWGWGTKIDRERARTLRSAACADGDPAACFKARPRGDAAKVARAALQAGYQPSCGRAKRGK